MYEYSYLIAVLSLGLIWACFFVVRKDLRKPMLTISCLFGIGGVASEFIYIRDWWSPTTIFGTAVGIEDFLFGFFFSGSVAVFFEVVTGSSYVMRQQRPKWPIRFRYIALLICITFFGSTLILRLHSFSATVIAFGVCILIMLFYRKGLIANACLSSTFAMLLAMLFFGIPEMITPGWIESAWALDNLSGHFVYYVPLEDFIWFVMAGAFIGPLFKFWKNLEAVQDVQFDAWVQVR